MKNLIILLLLFVCLNSLSSWKSTRKFKFYNNCPQTVWVGGMGNPQISTTGWEMKPKSSKTINVAANTAAIRFWPRTGCKWVNGRFKCDSGDCGTPSNNFGI